MHEGSVLCVHQRIALYKSYLTLLLFFLIFSGCMDTAFCPNVFGWRQRSVVFQWMDTVFCPYDFGWRQLSVSISVDEHGVSVQKTMDEDSVLSHFQWMHGYGVLSQSLWMKTASCLSFSGWTRCSVPKSMDENSVLSQFRAFCTDVYGWRQRSVSVSVAGHGVLSQYLCTKTAFCLNFSEWTRRSVSMLLSRASPFSLIGRITVFCLHFIGCTWHNVLSQFQWV